MGSSHYILLCMKIKWAIEKTAVMRQGKPTPLNCWAEFVQHFDNHKRGHLEQKCKHVPFKSFSLFSTTVLLAETVIYWEINVKVSFSCHVVATYWFASWSFFVWHNILLRILTVNSWYPKRSDSVSAESLQLLLKCRTHDRCLQDFRTCLCAAGIISNRSRNVK